jgi:ribosomal protein S18 acetylase RimI-like enzyme
VAPGIAVRVLEPTDPDAELATYVLLRDEDERFGLEPPGPAVVAELGEEIDSLRGVLERSPGWHVMATLDGRVAGTGRCQTGNDGLGEISAIVTERTVRRRGVAATVVSFLAECHFMTGGEIAWLSAANPTAQSVYARVGFQVIGDVLAYQE